jgi:hypothetical protein
MRYKKGDIIVGNKYSMNKNYRAVIDDIVEYDGQYFYFLEILNKKFVTPHAECSLCEEYTKLDIKSMRKEKLNKLWNTNIKK